MARVRTACQDCTAVVLLTPAQLLLLPATGSACAYLYSCPGCGRLTGGAASPAQELLLTSAGVRSPVRSASGRQP